MTANNTRLNKVATIIAKITEVFHWVGMALLFGALLSYFINKDFIKYFIGLNNSSEISIYGYTAKVIGEGGNWIGGAFVSTLIIGIISLGLMAMIFRNINLIFKTSEGKTKFSTGATPFQANNVRMIKEIGIFALSIPVVQFICDFITTAIVGWDVMESSVSTTGIFFGIAMICLSQFFAYGVQLQSDADGLV